MKLIYMIYRRVRSGSLVEALAEALTIEDNSTALTIEDGVTELTLEG